MFQVRSGRTGREHYSPSVSAGAERPHNPKRQRGGPIRGLIFLQLLALGSLWYRLVA
jgi:hypothetical protein